MEALEQEAAKGKPPAPVALGILARLLERRDQARELERIRQLTTDH